jgi:threonine-phosphate decarboxylase
MINGHGGNIFEMSQRIGCRPSEILDMSSNMNPLGPMDGIISHLKERLSTISALPEAGANRITASFAAHHGIRPEQTLAGNGTTQFIYSFPRALQMKRALIVGPTYADYADACSLQKVSCEFLMSSHDHDFDPDMNALMDTSGAFDTVYICNPNNPTGRMIPIEQINALCRRHPSVRFIVDESYLPFVTVEHRRSVIGTDLDNLIVLHSMSKIFTVPGLRIGFVVASKKLIDQLRPYTPPWSVNCLAQATVEYIMTHTGEVESFIETTADFVCKESRAFREDFKNHSEIKFYPSATVFLLGRLKNRLTSTQVQQELLKERILIRDCANFKGLSDRFIRIALKSEADNRRLAKVLKGLA